MEVDVSMGVDADLGEADVGGEGGGVGGCGFFVEISGNVVVGVYC